MQATEAPRLVQFSKLKKISFGYVDFYAKIFLILYTPFENSTTRIAIPMTDQKFFLNVLALENIQVALTREIGDGPCFLYIEFSWIGVH